MTHPEPFKNPDARLDDLGYGDRSSAVFLRGDGVWASPNTVFDATGYGAKGDGTTDDYAALQAAVNAASAAGGGIVNIPAGTFRLSTTLTIPSYVRLVGAGIEATFLRRVNGGAYILVDMSGASAANYLKSAGMEHLTLHGDDETGYTLLRLYYAAKLSFHRVRFYANTDTGFSAVQLWDSYFNQCRFDFVGGTDGTPGAVIANRSTDTVDAFGYSADSSNEIFFINCVQESSREGIWVAQNTGTATGSSTNPYNIHFLNQHGESNALRGPLIKFNGAKYCSVKNSIFGLNGWDSGYSTAVPAIEVGGSSQKISLEDIHFGSTASVDCVRSYIKATGSTRLRINDIDALYATGHGPTQALVEFTGTNNEVDWSRVNYIANQDSKTVVIGTPTTTKQSGRRASMFTSGNYVILGDSGSTSTSSTSGNSTVKAYPFYVDRPINIIRIGAEVTLAGESGSTVRLGIYNDNGKNFPGTVLVDGGTIDGTSATVQEVTVNVVLDPGLYWAGAAVQGASTTQPTVRTINSMPHQVPLGTSAPTAAQVAYGFAHTSVTGALPTFTASISPSGTFPRIHVKVA